MQLCLNVTLRRLAEGVLRGDITNLGGLIRKACGSELLHGAENLCLTDEHPEGGRDEAHRELPLNTSFRDTGAGDGAVADSGQELGQVEGAPPRLHHRRAGQQEDDQGRCGQAALAPEYPGSEPLG